MLSKIWNWITKVLCNHDWEDVPSELIQTLKATRVCKRCGKREW